MSKDKMTDAIGGIGDDLIAAAKKDRSGIIKFRRIAAAAACTALLVGVFCLTFPKDNNESPPPILQNTTATTFKPTTRPTTAPTTRPRPTTTPTSTKPTTTTKPSGASTTPSSSTVMASTNNENPFKYPPLVIRDEDVYNQLFAATEDVSIFAQNQDFVKTFGNQNELKVFVDKLQKLPIPHAEGAVCNILEYIPDYQMLNITLQTPDGVGYSFTFELNPDRADGICESFANRNMLLEQERTVRGCETFKTVTEFKLLSTISPGRYGCWVEIDGWLANFCCSGLSGDANLNSVLAQLSFDNTVLWN